jgi:hypothetical protein
VTSQYSTRERYRIKFAWPSAFPEFQWEVSDPTVPERAMAPRGEGPDITIPAAEPKRAVHDATSLSKGREILAKAQRAAGGADKLAAVRDITTKYTYKGNNGVEFAHTVRIVLPDTILHEAEYPFGKVLFGVSGNTGGMRGPQGAVAMSRDILANYKDELFRLREPLLLSDRQPGRIVNFLEDSIVNGSAASVIEISQENLPPVRMWVDEQSGDVLKVQYQSSAITGSPAEIEKVATDYREVGGLRAAFKSTVLVNGKEFAQIEVSQIRYNSGLDKATLMQPVR